MLRPVGSTAWTKERVPSVESSRFVYRNESITPLSPFEVKVGVYNNEGEGSLSTVSIVYSGEDGKLWLAMEWSYLGMYAYFALISMKMILSFFK